MLTLTLKQETAWLEHLDRPEFRRHLFYGGARSGKTDVILTWLCLQAAKYPGARILMARRTRIAAAKSLWSDSLVKMLRGRSDFKMLESDLEIRHTNGSLIRVDGFDDQERVDKILGTEYLHIFFNEA
ncbi:MAG: phage terminase large subunit, partial [Verrucomicrobiota bacterium]